MSLVVLPFLHRSADNWLKNKTWCLIKKEQHLLQTKKRISNEFCWEMLSVVVDFWNRLWPKLFKFQSMTITMTWADLRWQLKRKVLVKDSKICIDSKAFLTPLEFISYLLYIIWRGNLPSKVQSRKKWLKVYVIIICFIEYI